MAAISAPVPRARFAARWDKNRGVLGWITTVDHKKIAIMYLYTTFFFFLVGGVMALLVASSWPSRRTSSSLRRSTTRSSPCTGRR